MQGLWKPSGALERRNGIKGEVDRPFFPHCRLTTTTHSLLSYIFRSLTRCLLSFQPNHIPQCNSTPSHSLLPSLPLFSPHLLPFLTHSSWRLAISSRSAAATGRVSSSPADFHLRNQRLTNCPECVASLAPSVASCAGAAAQEGASKFQSRSSYSPDADVPSRRYLA
jgi:hypothetical protein